MGENERKLETSKLDYYDRMMESFWDVEEDEKEDEEE